MTAPAGQTNQSIIYNYWLSKGYTPAQAYGFVGNAFVESGFNPNSYNAAEGALGIEQVEGSRLTGLKAFAATGQQSPNDLITQLNYMYAELQGNFSGANAAIKASTTPADAATAIASKLEISASSNWPQRAAAANRAAAGEQLSGVTYTGAQVAPGGGAAGGTGAGGFGAGVGGTNFVSDVLPGGSWNPVNWPGKVLGGAANAASGAVTNAVESFVLALVKPLESYLEDAALIIFGVVMVLIAVILVAHASGHVGNVGNDDNGNSGGGAAAFAKGKAAKGGAAGDAADAAVLA